MSSETSMGLTKFFRIINIVRLCSIVFEKLLLELTDLVTGFCCALTISIFELNTQSVQTPTNAAALTGFAGFRQAARPTNMPWRTGMINGGEHCLGKYIILLRTLNYLDFPGLTGIIKSIVDLEDQTGYWRD
jgi:hypothetical protein